mmetsp:Transcript_22270/g.50894  ORF Transcript_22270/g.50894 Transcript_22270/m.50894 type:complete len:323 (+) Transcript_22270:75-1043(+)
MTEYTPATLKVREARLITAVKTPYTREGKVDLEAYDRLLEHQVKHGVEGVIVGGTTGEGHLFSWEEHLSLIAHTKLKFGDRLLVVGNTGSNSTGEMVSSTEKGFECGMDCSLLINPYYGKTSAKGIIMHIQAAMKFGPAIIYNVPGRTGQDIKPEILVELSKHKNFVGCKECMGSDRIKELVGLGIPCWSGNDDECYYSRRNCGATGVISVTSNVVPGLFKKLMSGDEHDALNEKLAPLYKWLFTEPNPIGVNTMLMQLGAAQPVFRLPYTFRDKALREEAVKMLTEIGLEHCPCFNEKGMQVLEDSDFVHTLDATNPYLPP